MKDDFKHIEQFYGNRFNNVLSIPDECSRWKLKTESIEKIKNTLMSHQQFIERRGQGVATDVNALNLSSEYIEAHHSSWTKYCAVCYVDSQELNYTPATRELYSEFKV